MTPATEQLPSLCPLDASGGAGAVAGFHNGRSEIAVEVHGTFLCDNAECIRPWAWDSPTLLVASLITVRIRPTVALDSWQRR
eukprot:m.198934 g.198934  ORF g.198934 m.198934 type:complete len:82 (+) comp18768_c1_seq1:1585-1830(+)